MKLFGFEITRAKDNQQLKQPSIVETETDDGAVAIAPAAAYGTYVDLDGGVRSEAQLIARYREMAAHPEVDNAIDDIVNEAIVQEPQIKAVTLNLDDTFFNPKIKEVMRQEFDFLLGLFQFNKYGYDIFRRWYIDGRLYYHIVIDQTNPLAGIQDLRYVDPRKMRKIREINRKQMAADIPVPIIAHEREYFVYNPKGFGRVSGNANISQSDVTGVKIAKDSIIYVSSGVLDKNHTTMISHLHKAIKVLNQLRVIEDAIVIYRISRAPERRIFYIDVGNLPKMKAEQYLNDIMLKFKNKLVYDPSSGEVKDDRKFMTMLEDFWLPRREGGRGTEISTLPAGQNLGELSDINYFLRQLYKALNIPEGRLESTATFDIGRGTEITRDEVNFSKFITRLRVRFSDLFITALEKQVILKGIMTPEEWDAEVQNIRIDFAKDNYFSEVKEAEIWNIRLESLERIQPFLGIFFSTRHVQETILNMTDDDIEKMEAEMAAEQEINIQKYMRTQMMQAQADQQLIKAGVPLLPPQEEEPNK